ncbi:hypothetical protein LEN26_018984 [Aphanomyces euteiches]|nr:hypothetical protein LEN26_018984 [Aphanomyces euteiches]KAH9129793.1 hypothetical protein AeMF1_000213 [Aphanomyces euteiches]KAH9195895.1 hypothetical protein AeNC1_002120 [Aphanomyces euteiches]
MSSPWLNPPNAWEETPFAASLSNDLTNQHSRSLTILKALQRLNLLVAKSNAFKRKHKLPNEVDSPMRLVLHIVGADFREGNEVAETLQVFEHLIALFHASQASSKATDHGYAELVLVMIGPNVARKLHGKDERIELSPGKSLRLIYATEIWEEHLVSPTYLSPTAIICFNAGVWGYDEWLPTFQRMMREEPLAPIVVTSYNEFEAIDDEDAIADVEMPLIWHWRHEPNPFASLAPRASQHTIADRVLHENSQWLCFGAKK